MKKIFAIFSLLFLLPVAEFSVAPLSHHSASVEIESQQDSSLPDADKLWIENSGENTSEEYNSNATVSPGAIRLPAATHYTGWLIQIAQTIGFHTSLDQIFLRGPPVTA